MFYLSMCCAGRAGRLGSVVLSDGAALLLVVEELLLGDADEAADLALLGRQDARRAGGGRRIDWQSDVLRRGLEVGVEPRQAVGGGDLDRLPVGVLAVRLEGRD